MAFILHLIDASEVTSVKAADQFLSEQERKSSERNPKFDAFVNDITKIYPDLSEDDLDGDDEHNVWEEGIADRTMTGRVIAIALKEDVTDEQLVTAIANAAVNSGLQLFDSEGLVLYREDGTVVDRRGKAEAF